MKSLGAIFLGIIGVIIIAGVFVSLDLFGIFYREQTADIRGKSAAEVSILSGQSRIQRYQEFFNLCQGVQSKETAIDALNANTTMNAQARDVAITANQTARSDLITRYNSLANQYYTAGRFQAENLPANITLSLYQGNNKTICN